ncbi:MAG: DUF3253 domain-containing protein [Pseudomonadota bacterium]
MTWRRRWASNWESVKYCSKACRRRGVPAEDQELETLILTLLEQRAADATICPSEAARRAAAAGDWRDLMEPVRCAARRLVARGQLEIVQGGRPVDPSTARGPIRLRRPR